MERRRSRRRRRRRRRRKKREREGERESRMQIQKEGKMIGGDECGIICYKSHEWLEQKRGKRVLKGVCALNTRRWDE